MSRNEHNNNGLIDCHGSSKALRLLETLTRTPAGNVLYQQIERILHEADHTQDRIIRGYTALVLTLIESYRRKLPRDSLLYLELKLIQKRLIPPISIAELATLQSYIKNASRLINELSDVDDEIIKQALGPLLGKIANNHNQFDTYQDDTTHSAVATEQHIDSVYRQKLDQQRRELQQLQNQITDKITESSQQYTDFNRILKSAHTVLQQIDGSQDITVQRNQICHEIDQLLHRQTNLSRVLDETKQLLDRVNSNSQQLSHELDQVRVLSLTDDLTHLPNRRAFIRRLEDEINRSQRESSPLTLGILDLDHFKNINDKYGHNVGDEILRIYARDVLSIFRHYDMVARYGGEEFAVILPNTDKEGALRAFTKVKNKAAGHYYRQQDISIALPSFSAGLAMHQPGESPEEFIERVDALLYKAKRSGRNHIEFGKDSTHQQQITEDSLSD